MDVRMSDGGKGSMPNSKLINYYARSISDGSLA